MPAMIYVATFVISLAQAFVQPVWSALIPRIVGDHRIGPAIAWQRGLSAVANPVGYAIGGLLVGLHQARWGFLGDAASYLIVAAAALTVRTRRQPRRMPQSGSRSSWMPTIRIPARDPIIWPLFVTILIFVILVEGINPVEVFLVRDSLKASSFQYGLSEFFAGAGAILGALIAGRIATTGHRARAAAIGFGAPAISLISAGYSPNYWTYAGMLILLSAGYGIGNATFGALLITRTDDQDRGKVYAALGGLS
jgi:MFS family permease